MGSFVARSASMRAAFMLLCASGAAIAQTPQQSRAAAQLQRVELRGAPVEILDAAIEGHSDVWRRRGEPGWIEHVDSGLACAARHGNYTLSEIAFHGAGPLECSYSDEQGEVRFTVFVVGSVDGLAIADFARKLYHEYLAVAGQPVLDPTFENFGGCEAARFRLLGPKGEGTAVLVDRGRFVFVILSVSRTRTPDAERSASENAGRELLEASVRC